LADLASTLFSPIQNRGQDPAPMINQHPFGPSEKGASVLCLSHNAILIIYSHLQTLVSVQTIMSFHAVEISFPLDYQPPHWRYKPANFITYFAGHEGPGSLHSYLKKQGWITALSAGTQNLARGFAMYKLTIHLTSEGFRASVVVS
jgi:insulysin